MENTIKLIKDFFKQGEWKYSYKKLSEKRAMFSSNINMNNVIGNLHIFIFVHRDYYIVNAVLNSFVEECYYAQVSEYLHRANCGLPTGNFEFDFDDGEVKFKTYVSFEGVQLSADVVEESILLPVFMFDRYGKNLLRLMLGEGNPKKLIEEAEMETSTSDNVEQ